MREIPGLSAAVVNRAVELSAKARDARAVAPVQTPQATVSPVKVNGGVATLRLFDYIDGDGGYWGISAQEVADALDAVDRPVERIELRINSGGGSVWDGLAILNTLRAHKAPVTAIVDGIAASAASFIACAADETVMMPNSKMMIHDALGLCIGQAVDMRAYADFLDDGSDGIAEIYAAKAGGTAEEWRAVMVEKGLLGRWYTAQETVDAGLADRVETVAPADDSEPAEAPAAAARTSTPENVEPASEASAPPAMSELQKRRHRMNARRVAARA